MIFKNILITGGAGFIGSHVLRRMVRQYPQTHFVNLDALTYAGNLNDIKDVSVASNYSFVQGDIADSVLVQSLFQQYQFDGIIHLAAESHVDNSIKNPLGFAQTNVMGTIHVLEGLRKLNKPCNSIIITTDKVYWNFERDTPYKETDQLGGYDPYSNSKAAADITINSYQKSFFNLDNFEEHQQGISTVRSGNVIGGGDMAENRIIPDCVKSLENNQPISVRNPNAVRPWQHVLDPLYGYLLLGAKLQEEPKKYSEAFNFGPETEDVNTVYVLNVRYHKSTDGGK